jgi:hypothetical protein
MTNRIDFVAIRREAQAAGEEFLTHRWDAYLEMVRRVEELPENRSGADKSWVERACEEYRRHYRNAVPVPRDDE